jgi:hypothetical protein
MRFRFESAIVSIGKSNAIASPSKVPKANGSMDFGKSYFLRKP